MANRRRTGGKSKLPILAMAVVIVLVALVGFAWMYSKNESGTLPPISSEPLVVNSVQQNLEAYRGKVVILDIWATWCGPCRVEIPDFIKLQNQYRSQGLEIVGVSIDPYTQTGAAAVAPFMKSNGINYSIWMVNSQAALGSFQPAQGSIPTTFIIDKTGRVVKTHVGAKPFSVFENDIKPLL